MKFPRVCGVFLLFGMMLVISGRQATPPTISATAPVSTTSTSSPHVAIPRASILLLEDWRFADDKDPIGEQQGWADIAFDDSAWVSVAAPHTWNVMPAYADCSGLAW
jgi:hypothetical protein